MVWYGMAHEDDDVGLEDKVDLKVPSFGECLIMAMLIMMTQRSIMLLKMVSKDWIDDE